MAHVAKQIIGSFEDIGKDIARETVKVPGEVVGKALESLGSSSGKKTQGAKQTRTGAPGNGDRGALGKLEETKDQKAKQAIARQALEQFAGSRKQKEPTVQERLEKEKAEKAEKQQKEAAGAAKMAPIQEVSTKQKRGNLYGVKQKTTQVENKGTRSD